MEANLSVWHKCGAVPLTRLPLLSKEVRREILVGVAASLIENEEDDPEVERLKRIEAMNVFFCDTLTAFGYDGSQLLKSAPTRTTFVAVTQPHSKERILAIKKAKTAGQLFYATGGQHVNTNEFFQASELKVRDAEIKVMEDAKKGRKKYCDEQQEAVLMIRKKGELTHVTEKSFTIPEIKTLLKWKKIKIKSTKKKDMVAAYIAAPKPPIQKVW